MRTFHMHASFVLGNFMATGVSDFILHTLQCCQFVEMLYDEFYRRVQQCSY